MADNASFFTKWTCLARQVPVRSGVGFSPPPPPLQNPHQSIMSISRLMFFALIMN